LRQRFVLTPAAVAANIGLAVEDSVLALVIAMAAIRRRLFAREQELQQEFGDTAGTSSSITATQQLREDAPDFIQRSPRAHFGPGIEIFLTLHLEDGSEVEWFGWAINRLDGQGWAVEREVSLVVPDGRPEVNRVAGSDLPEVTISDSGTFVSRLPSLVEELIALPVPERPSS
jgi:hypothetical protein